MNPLRPMHVPRSPWTSHCARVPNRCLGGVADLPRTTARTIRASDHNTFFATSARIDRPMRDANHANRIRPLQRRPVVARAAPEMRLDFGLPIGASPLKLSGNEKPRDPVESRAPHNARPPASSTLISRHQTDDSSGNRFQSPRPFGRYDRGRFASLACAPGS